MSMSERDKELLRIVGMSEQQAERNARQAESESEPDGLTGRVYYGLHLAQPDEQEEMVTVSVRLPKATVDSLNQQARRYHISRSEYIRRRLAPDGQ